MNKLLSTLAGVVLLTSAVYANHAYAYCFKSDPPLVHAACEGDLPQVKKLLSEGANPNEGDTLGRKPLYFAMAGYNFGFPSDPSQTPCTDTRAIEISKLLIAAGADCSIRDGDGNSLVSVVLHTEPTCHQIPLIQLLLAGGIDLSKKNRFGETVFHTYFINEFADAGLLKAVGTELVKNGVDLYAVNNRGQTAAEIAIKAIVPHWEVFKYNADFIRAFINLGVDVNRQNPKDGITPLMSAAIANRTDIGELFLSAGSTVATPDNKGLLVQHYASAYADEKFLTLLLPHITNIEAADQQGRTALMVAAFAGRAANADFLLKQKAKINVLSTSGFSPLMWLLAGRKQNLFADAPLLDTFKVLVDAGAKPNLHGKALSPLAMAIGNERIRDFGTLQTIVATLTKKGANPNFRSDFGDYSSLPKQVGPLTVLVHRFLDYPRDKVKIAEILVDAGANVDLRDADGKTALDHAKKSGAWSLKPLIDYLSSL